MRNRRGIKAIGLLMGLLLPATPSWSATEVGVTSAVLPNAHGTPPGGTARIMQIGLDVVSNEQVTTGPKGKLQLLFLDGSALTLGPNSDVTIDTFVYDPDSRTGQLAMSTTKGLFRLVGGRISKTRPITLKTPNAVIGIRGGIMTTRVSEQQTSSTFHFGEQMTVEAGGERVSVQRPGFQVDASAEGPPSAPRPVSDQAMADDLNGFESDSEQADEAGVDVADEDIAGTQLADLSPSVEPVVQTGGGAGPAAGSDVGDAEDNAEVTTAQQQEVTSNVSGGSTIAGFVGRGKRGIAALLGTQDNVSGQNFGLSSISVSGGRFVASAGLSGYDLQFPSFTGESTLSGSNSTPFGNVSGTAYLSSAQDFVAYELSGSQQLVFAGIPTLASAFPTSGITTYDVRNDFTLGGSRIPFIPAALGGSLTPLNPAQANIYWGTAGSNVYPVLFLGTLAFSGTGSSQQQSASLIVGNLPMDASGRRFFRGTMAGVSLLASTTDFFFFDGEAATSDAGTGEDFFGLSGPNFAVLEGADVDTLDTTLSTGVDFATGTASDITYHPNAPLIGTANKSGVGNLRTAVLLNLYTGGVSRDFSGSSFLGAHGFYTTNTTSTTVVGGATVPFSRVRTNPSQNAIEAALFIDSPFSDGIQNTVFELGSFNNGVTSAFIDDGHYGAIQDSSLHDAGLVRNIHIDLSTITPSGVSLCTCSFVHWGFWAAQRNSTTRHDIGLTPWVAAERLPSSGYINGVSGTFAGDAIATVADGDHDSNGTVKLYTAIGSYSFNMSISGSNINVTSGQMSIDGASLTFSATGTLSGGATEYNGTMSGSRNGMALTGIIRGGFAGMPTSSSSPPQNSFGHFQAYYNSADPQYQVSGVHKSQLQP